MYYYRVALKEIPMVGDEETTEQVAAVGVEHEEIHFFLDSIVIRTELKLKDGDFIEELLPTNEIITSHESWNELKKEIFIKRDNSGKCI